MEITTAKAESSLFDTALQYHTTERMLIRKILCAYTDQQCCIGIFPGTGMVTHAIDAHASLLACCGNDLTARTHTEGINASPIRRMLIQLVGCSAKRGMLRKPTILTAIDQRLRMFYTHTDRKGLLNHGHALIKERLNRIASTVANGQDHRVSQQFAAFVPAFPVHAFDMIASDDQPGKPGRKADFTAQCNNLSAHARNDTFKKVRTNVRLLLPLDLLGSTMFHKNIKHLLLQRRLNARGQFAVRKSSGTAFAKLNIAFRIKHTLFRHQSNICGTFLYAFASFEQDRLSPCSGERQGRKQARRPCSDHYRTFCKSSFGDRKLFFRRGRNCCISVELFQYSCFIFYLSIDGHHKMDVSLIARINALLDKVDRYNLCLWQTELARGLPAHCRFIHIQRQVQIHKPQQSVGSFLVSALLQAVILRLRMPAEAIRISKSNIRVIDLCQFKSLWGHGHAKT